jgi:hypothetical protein
MDEPNSLEAAGFPGRAPPADSPRCLREAVPIFLRHPSPLILLAALGSALGVRVALGDGSAWDLVPLAALFLVWPVQEWLIHVFVLHWEPRSVLGRTLDFRVPRKHRAHHRDPWNLELVFIPVHSYLYTLPLLVLVWFAVAPSPELALTGIAGQLFLTLHYESVHFLVHTRVRPRTRYYESLWRNHRLHHFKNEAYWYGVTRLEGDRWLGTSADPARVPHSATARALGG